MADLQSRLGPKVKEYHPNLSWVRPGFRVSKPQKRIQSSEQNQWHSRNNDSDSLTSEEDRDMSYDSPWQHSSQKAPTLLARMQQLSEPKSLIDRVGSPITEDYSSRNQIRRRSRSIRMDEGEGDGDKSSNPTIESECINGELQTKTVSVTRSNGIASGHEAMRNLGKSVSFVQAHRTASEFHLNHNGIHLQTSDAASPGDHSNYPSTTMDAIAPNSTNLMSNPSSMTSLSHSQSQSSGREDGQFSERSKSTPSSNEVRNHLLSLVLLNAEERLKQAEREGAPQESIVELNPDAITKEDSAAFYKNMRRVNKDLKGSESTSPAINYTLHVSHAPIASDSTPDSSSMPQSSTMIAGTSRLPLPAQTSQQSSQTSAYMDPGRRMMIEKERARPIERKSPSRNVALEEDFHSSTSTYRRASDGTQRPSTSPSRSTGYKRERPRGSSHSSQISESRYNKRPRSISPVTSMAPDPSYHRHRRGSHATTSSSSRRSPEPRNLPQDPPYHHNRRASYATTTSSHGPHSPDPYNRRPLNKSPYSRNRPEYPKFPHGQDYDRRDFKGRRSRSPVDRRGSDKHREDDYPPRRYQHNKYDRGAPYRYNEHSKNRYNSPERPRRQAHRDDEYIRRSASPIRQSQNPSNSGPPSSKSPDRLWMSSHVPTPGPPSPHKPPEELPQHNISDDRSSPSSIRRPAPDINHTPDEYTSRSMSLESSLSKRNVVEESQRRSLQSEPMQIGLSTPPPHITEQEEEDNIAQALEPTEQDRSMEQGEPMDQENMEWEESRQEEELMNQQEFVEQQESMEQEEPVDQEEFMEQEELEEEQQQILPCHLVPGFWFFKIGLSDMGTLKCSFEIDHQTAVKWNIPALPDPNQPPTPMSDVFDPTQELRPPKVSLQLCSLSQQLVQNVMQEIGPDPSPEQLTRAVYSTDKRWPPAGELIIEVNRETDKRKTLLPQRLKPASPPVMIEDHVYEGMNEIQFIQLAGTPDTMFALYATEKPQVSYLQQRFVPLPTQRKGPDYIEPAVVTVRPLP